MTNGGIGKVRLYVIINYDVEKELLVNIIIDGTTNEV